MNAGSYPLSISYLIHFKFLSPCRKKATTIIILLFINNRNYEFSVFINYIHIVVLKMDDDIRNSDNRNDSGVNGNSGDYKPRSGAPENIEQMHSIKLENISPRTTKVY